MKLSLVYLAKKVIFPTRKAMKKYSSWVKYHLIEALHPPKINILQQNGQDAYLCTWKHLPPWMKIWNGRWIHDFKKNSTLETDSQIQQIEIISAILTQYQQIKIISAFLTFSYYNLLLFLTISNWISNKHTRPSYQKVHSTTT